MNIQIIDRSKGKLWIAVNYLKDIVETGIGLQLSPSIYETYRPLWDFLKVGVDLSPVHPADLKLIFIDQKADLHNETSPCLFFPLAPLSAISDKRLIPTDGLDGLPHRQDVIDMLLRKNKTDGDFANKRILISAGPTAEDIDPVRFLTNRSTGKMGVALARAAYLRGADVCLVCGPLSIRQPAYLETIRIRSAEEMSRSIKLRIKENAVFISAAAVADYTSQKIHTKKLKKGSGDLHLNLQRTTDILSELRKQKRDNQFFVGFSVETENLKENSLGKLEGKGLDLIVANNPSEKGAGFAHDTNRVMLISALKSEQLPLLSKIETANLILDYVIRHAKLS